MWGWWKNLSYKRGYRAGYKHKSAHVEPELKSHKKEVKELRLDLAKEVINHKSNIARERAEHSTYVKSQKNKIKKIEAALALSQGLIGKIKGVELWIRSTFQKAIQTNIQVTSSVNESNTAIVETLNSKVIDLELEQQKIVDALSEIR